jgi:hypothetical protein
MQVPCGGPASAGPLQRVGHAESLREAQQVVQLVGAAIHAYRLLGNARQDRGKVIVVSRLHALVRANAMVIRHEPDCIAYLELGGDAGTVQFDGTAGQPQQLPDLMRRPALHDMVEDLALALGQQGKAKPARSRMRQNRWSTACR